MMDALWFRMLVVCRDPIWTDTIQCNHFYWKNSGVQFLSTAASARSQGSNNLFIPLWAWWCPLFTLWLIFASLLASHLGFKETSPLETSHGLLQLWYHDWYQFWIWHLIKGKDPLTLLPELYFTSGHLFPGSQQRIVSSSLNLPRHGLICPPLKKYFGKLSKLYHLYFKLMSL